MLVLSDKICGNCENEIFTSPADKEKKTDTSNNTINAAKNRIHFKYFLFT